MTTEEIIALAARQYFEHQGKYKNPYRQGGREFDAYERGWMQSLKRDGARQIDKPTKSAPSKSNVSLYEQAKARGKPFTTFAEASAFAKGSARERCASVRIVRRGVEFFVESDASLASVPIQPPGRGQNGSTPSSKQTTSVSGSRIAHPVPTPIAPRRAKGRKKKPLGLSAAAAKRTSSKKGERIHNIRSIFITDSVEPKVISGGLPSLGKRK